MFGAVVPICEKDEILARAFAEGSFHSLGWNRPPEVGWAMACVAMAASNSPEAVIASTGSPVDRAHIIDAFLLGGYFPEPHMTNAFEGLLRSSSPLSVLCAAELIWRALSSASAAMADQRLSSLASADENSAVVAFAGVLDHLIVRGLQRRSGALEDLDVDEATAERFLQAGAEIIKRPADIRRIAQHSGRREIYVLGSLASWWQDVPLRRAANDELKRCGFSLYTELFRETLGDGDDLDDVHVSYSMIEPLVAILSEMEFSVDQFTERFDRLACDRISRDTRFGTWLRDRTRALLLLIVCGRVAQCRGDEDLLRAVRDRAEWITTQPRADQPFEYAPVEELEAQLGLPLPRS